MEEEHKEETKVEEHKPKRRFPKINLTKWDIISVIILIIFVIIVSIPIYTPKEGCEVARPNYECASLKDVMIENCVYWGRYDCDSNADVSLPQVEWYIESLCNLQNKYHNTGLDCSNLKTACNKIAGNQTCLISYLG